MQPVKHSGPARTTHFSNLGELRRALAARGVTVHTHRADPDGARWELFVGRKGRYLRVSWDSAASELHLEPTGADDPDGAHTESVEPAAIFRTALSQIARFYDLTAD